MKLTSEQIEAIRKAAPELADKLEAGEAVTVECEVKRWEPRLDIWATRIDDPIIKRMLKLLAYREEFAPGYVVPDIGEKAWCVGRLREKWITMTLIPTRCPTDVYMPEDVAKELARKLNSGEVAL